MTNHLPKSAEIPSPSPPESYLAIKSLVLDLIEQNYEDLDILVAVNEKFDNRDLVEATLEDLRKKGII